MSSGRFDPATASDSHLEAEAAGKNSPRQILGVGRCPESIIRGRTFLESLGFAVVTATTLAGAVAACAARRFDLIIVGRGVPSSLKSALRQHLQTERGLAMLGLCDENDPALLSRLRNLQARANPFA